MSNITVLDQNTINQIAAGEVVERPASVVKELIENAIDANATAITCEIKDGGVSFIRITDNGAGINKEEIPVAFLRHSTSKIRSVEDLLTIGSLGFRGEALSSIASVAQVELVTKTRSSLIGARYIIEGGEEQNLSEIGCPDGTTFLVRNLFFNTPARKKFLKSANTEAAYISDLIERLAISHPEISFKFINNNKTVLHTFGNSQLKDIIYHVFGRSIAAELVPIQNSFGEVSIEGFIGKPIISRGNRNFENYFINGRYIKSAIIGKAIEEAYKPYSMQHKYPFTALHLHVPSNKIDVNVHPTKMEIRFTEAEEVYQLVHQTLKLALSNANMIPDMEMNTTEKEEKKVYQAVPEPFEKSRLSSIKPVQTTSKGFLSSLSRYDVLGSTKDTELAKLREVVLNAKESSVYQATVRKEENIFDKSEENSEVVSQIQDEAFLRHDQSTESLSENHMTCQVKQESAQVKQESAQVKHEGTQVEQESTQVKLENSQAKLENMQVKLENIQQESFLTAEDHKKSYVIVGQVFATYWMVECDQQLYIIDQHAAHEKILYEKTMKRLEEKQGESQMISPPMILTLNLKEEEVLKQHEDLLKRLGFEIEPFGGKEYAVSGVPADMYGLSGQDLFLDFLDDLVQDVPKGTPDVILEKIASMSCKAAVKGNHKLSTIEAKNLIEQLLSLENPFHCPHGRPIIVSMTKYELEKNFKRVL